MGKYSSDSDYERYSSKKSHKSRRRSDSSDSSTSRTHRRKEKKRHRSKSRDRYTKSRRSRSSSRQNSYKSKHLKSRDRKSSRDRHRRSESQDKYRSRRSRSRSYIREYTSKSKKRSSSSSSSSSDTKRAPNKKESKLPLNSNMQIKVEEKSPVISSKILDDINCESFEPKQFNSNTKKVPDNIVIDLRKQTIKVPEVEPLEPDTIYHHNLFLNEEARMEKWIKELYSYRQKALQQGLRHH